MRVIGRRYDTEQVVAIETAKGRITGLENHRDPALLRTPDEISWVAPGFVDLQVNGHGGLEFNDHTLTVQQVGQISRSLAAYGVTSYCPTATTQSFERLSHVLRTIAAACDADDDVSQRIAGIHLEGPYISPEDGPRGAHPRPHCRPPEWDEFRRLQDAANGRIRILTLSPEYDGAARFISQVVANGTLVALGHTAANSEQIRAAVDAGARMSTHLGNGAHGQIRRHPNYIWDQLAEDRLVASLIVDGHHLPAAVVKCFVRAKSADRCILVSDITGMAGMPPGRYENSGLGAVEVLEDGRLVIAGQRQYLAGAALPISVGIPNVMRFANVDLSTAVAMATAGPAALIGKELEFFQVGAVADFVLFQLRSDAGQPQSLDVCTTIKRGQVVYGRL